MLYEAAYWRPHASDSRPPLEVMLRQREYAHYVTEWGRAGDVALAALDQHDQPVGAAWYRRLPAGDRGFGYVADDVPELSIGVVGEFRGRGVGSLLISALAQRARAHDERALSLSVEPDNPARTLYERFGFREFGHDAGGSITMVLPLIAAAA